MVRTSAIKHRGPQQNRVLDNEVILLRQVDFRKLGPNVVDILRNTPLRAGEPEGDMPWFLDGYVAAEQPRDMLMSEALMSGTTGFAIARVDSGEILAQFSKKDYVKAFDVAKNAKVEIAVNNLLGNEEDEEDE